MTSPAPHLRAPPGADSSRAAGHAFDWLLDSVEVLRHRAGRVIESSRRAELGQFLTPVSIARFMAGMARETQDTIRVLDAGAGIGSLTAALVAELGSRRHKPRRVDVTAFEIDPAMANMLGSTLTMCEESCAAEGIAFTGKALQEDFIRFGSEVVEGGLLASPRPIFDCVILNPPYRKIRADSPERKRLHAAGLETTNLYTAFLFLSAHLLVPGGELIAITPRSFCNGPYFRAFRREFLGMMRLERLHVFETRDTAFGDDDVLQENVIFRAVKSDGHSGRVHITSSASPSDPDISQRIVPYGEVVDENGGEYFIHIVPDEMNAAVAQRMACLRGSLAGLGVSVSTGRVVDFRATRYLRKEADGETAPLLYPSHLVNGRVCWPKPDFRKHNAILDCDDTASLMVPQGTYVLVKRFSAKEEPRRLVAALIHSEDIPHPRWGFENHLNYLHDSGSGLQADLARGLAAFLNTTLVDTYFRQFNGHTQVNATDLRSLPFPTYEELEGIGEEIGDKVPSQEELDTLVEEHLSHIDW